MDNISLYRQGRKLLENSEYFEATVYWQELSKRNPEDKESESYLRLCLSKIGREQDIEKARIALEDALRSAEAIKSYGKVYRFLELCLLLTKDTEKRSEVSHKLFEARNLWEEDKSSRIDFAKKATTRDQVNSAKTLLQEILEVDPYEVEVLRLLDDIQNKFEAG